MIRSSIALFCLFAVFGCSTPVPKATTPTSFEDSFRRQGRTETGTPFIHRIPYINRMIMNSSVGCGNFFWEDALGNTAAVVSPDGNWLLTAGRPCFSSFGTGTQGETMSFHGDSRVSLWSLTDPKDKKVDYVPFDRENPEIDWLAFTSDSSQFFVFRRPTGNYKPGTLKRHDRATGKELQTIAPSLAAQTGAVSPDGQRLVAVTLDSIEVWNAVNGQKFGSIPFGEPIGVNAIRFSPDSRLLFVGCSSNEIKVINLQAGRQVASVPLKKPDPNEFLHGEPRKTCFAVSSDGKTLAVIDSQQLASIMPKYRLRLIEIGTWKVLREIKSPEQENVTHTIDTIKFLDQTHEIHAVCFSPEGDKLYGIGLRRAEAKDTEIKSFLGEFDLSRETGTWTDIPYETLPLHPIGKRLLMNSEGGHAYLTKYSERMGVDFNVKWSKLSNDKDRPAILSDAEIVVTPSPTSK